jgi:hypothetical protein
MLAYALPYRRFVGVLTDANARLGADVDRYTFIVVDLQIAQICRNPAEFWLWRLFALVRWNLKCLAISYRVGRCHCAADLPRDLELYAVTSSSQEQPSRNIIVQRVGSGHVCRGATSNGST